MRTNVESEEIWHLMDTLARMLMSSDSVFSRAAIAMIASQCMAYRFALLI